MITNMPTQKMKIFLLIVCGTIAMLETAAAYEVGECQRGDGVGGSEKKLSGLYSRQQCIEAVRSQYPDANGFTFGSWSSYRSCGTRCECYAEFDMTDWDNKRTWESCKFLIYYVVAMSSASHIESSSGAASLTYQDKKGQYRGKCRWRRTCHGGWTRRCLRRGQRC